MQRQRLAPRRLCGVKSPDMRSRTFEIANANVTYGQSKKFGQVDPKSRRPQLSRGKRAASGSVKQGSELKKLLATPEE